MSKQWQIRRGTTVENDSFTGAIGELTMDTDKKQIRLHDGVTEGGISIMAEKDTVGYCSFNTDTRIQITTTNQTAAKNGWLLGFFAYTGSNASGKIYVNDIEVSRGSTATGTTWGNVSVQIPIKAGQTYMYNLDSSATMQNNLVYFYPND